MKLFDKLVDFHEDPSEGVLIEHKQEIPEDFLTSLRNEKIDSLHTPTGNFYRVASIPVALVEQWLREDPPYDVTVAPVRETLRRLNASGNDGFITTNKRI